MCLTASMEDYLKTIFILYREQGYARCVDVSELYGRHYAVRESGGKGTDKSGLPDERSERHAFPDHGRRKGCRKRI